MTGRCFGQVHDDGWLDGETNEGAMVGRFDVVLNKESIVVINHWHNTLKTYIRSWLTSGMSSLSSLKVCFECLWYSTLCANGDTTKAPPEPTPQGQRAHRIHLYPRRPEPFDIWVREDSTSHLMLSGPE